MRNAKKGKTDSAARRAYVSQSEVPAHPLDHALQIPLAIHRQYGGKPTAPLMVAKALDMMPSSSTFRMLCGAAVAYGLTKGGAKSNEIAVTELGLRIVRPLNESDELAGRREAFLTPRVVREFAQKYNGCQLPSQDIARNVLETFGVARDRAMGVLALIESGARSVGFIQEIKGNRYVQIVGTPAAPSDAATTPETAEPGSTVSGTELAQPPELLRETQGTREAGTQAMKRVFITHGKNKALVDPIKKLLAYGELHPVVSVERQSVSKPVPDKVMGEMRTCGAAIIHVDAEQTLIDKEAKEHKVINPNVLIEIGAALALYGRRFILLVREGVELPSNLQGLYEVRYEGEVLDGDATIRLLEAINDIKNHPLPQRYGTWGDGDSAEGSA